jgi:chorismate dehydratase
VRGLRVARIPYLNSVPFYANLDGAGHTLVDMPPRELGRLAIDGDVDAGILSLCDLHRNGNFESLGPIGIGVDGPAHSVLLFSRGSLRDLDGATIAITGETSTSFPLLRLLLEEQIGVVPVDYCRRPEGAHPGDAGELLIGDAALRRAAAGGLVPGLADYTTELIPLVRPTANDWTHVTDLGAAWQRWQSLPFVFARWAVAHHVADEQRQDLRARIERSLQANAFDLLPLGVAHGAVAGLDGEAAAAYLAGFKYQFGAREEAGQERFLELLDRSDWWSNAEQQVPVEVAG